MYCVNTQAFDMASVLVKKSCYADVLLLLMERFEERKQTRGGRVLMIGNIFWVIIPFSPKLAINHTKAGNPQNWERKERCFVPRTVQKLLKHQPRPQ